MKKYEGQNVTSNFRQAVVLTNVRIPQPGPGSVLVRNRYLETTNECKESAKGGGGGGGCGCKC